MLKHFSYPTAMFSILCLLSTAYAATPSGMVVFQSDFGIQDGAVSEVKGIMYGVDKSLIISDLTNEIPAYNIWDASYRLYQTSAYWPKGSVFVSVVDPGVGTTRHSIVAEGKDGQYYVTPDNGTLTLISEMVGLKEVRTIDENKNRLKGSNASYTFHGRDVYGYTAARLAAHKISFSDVGPVLNEPVVTLPYQKAEIKNNSLYGTIMILDVQYGNVWTNINKSLLDQFNLKIGAPYQVTIYHHKQVVFAKTVRFQHTFGEVKKGENLLYVNSLLDLAVATNQNNFAHLYHVGYGPDWTMSVTAK
jgi:S-adenosylmethionine hydrolase